MPRWLVSFLFLALFSVVLGCSSAPTTPTASDPNAKPTQPPGPGPIGPPPPIK